MPFPYSGSVYQLDAEVSVVPSPIYRNATLTTEFSAGYQQTRPRYARQLRSWLLRFDAIDQDDLDMLVDFWQNVAIGGANSWRWDHPTTGETHITVRFHPQEDLEPEPVVSGGTDETTFYMVEFTVMEV